MTEEIPDVLTAAADVSQTAQQQVGQIQAKLQADITNVEQNPAFDAAKRTQLIDGLNTRARAEAQRIQAATEGDLSHRLSKQQQAVAAAELAHVEELQTHLGPLYADLIRARVARLSEPGQARQMHDAAIDPKTRAIVAAASELHFGADGIITSETEQAAALLKRDLEPLRGLVRELPERLALDREAALRARLNL